MSTVGLTLSNLELNNQLIMSKKNSKCNKNSVDCTEPPPLVAAQKEPDIDMSHLLGLSVGMETNFGQVENKINSEEPKLSKEDPQETRHLKELLLLHLDWIQQQQESLLAKDKLILRLKQEKEALKCRLERMDRRMSLLRHKSDPPTPSTHTTDQTTMSPRAKDIAPPQGRGITTPTQGRGVANPARSEPGLRGSKRKHSLEPQSLGRRFNSLTPAGKSPRLSNMVNRGTSMDDLARSPSESATTPPRGKLSRLSRTQRLKETPSKHQAYLYSQQPPRKCRSQNLAETEGSEKGDSDEDSKSKSDRSSDSDSDDEVQFVDQSARKRLMVRLGHDNVPSRDNSMRTDTLYYVPTRMELPPWDISPKKPDKADHVIVPTFRIKHVPTGYQLEGTENLTDEIYNKRHQKPEADEKRRKRWDAQMLREQKMLERLQQRGGATPGPSGGANTPRNRRPEPEPLTSLLPDPDNIKFLELCDNVPVMAFGYPVPNLAEKEFSLGWFDADKRSREDHHSNHRGGRGRRKHTVTE